MLKKILSNFEENKDITSAKDVINYFKLRRSNEEIFLLTKVLAYSGATLPKDEYVVDIPSTGGPSSLSTILCPIYLAASGLKVRKLGVSGRPAGGIDVLSQIPGYKTTFAVEDIRNIISKKVSYFHFESGETFAPLDAMLFKFRKELNEIDVPQLAIASLLAKKVSVGVTAVNLDVRASEFGNFGKSFEECHENAIRFCEVASLCGITAICTVSDASVPYQPFIGRREALIAIYNILYGQADKWLQNHNLFCQKLSYELVVTNNQKYNLDNKLIGTLPAVRIAFETNLQLQGASLIGFKDAVINNGKEIIIESAYSGIICYNLDIIRNSIISAQNCVLDKENGSKYCDPVGVELLVEPGVYVEKGTPIFRLRYRMNTQLDLNTKNWYMVSKTEAKNIYSRKVQVI